MGCLGLALLPTFIIGADIHVALFEYIPVVPHVYALYLPAKVRTFTDFLPERFSPDPYWDRDWRTFAWSAAVPAESRQCASGDLTASA